MKTPQQQNRRSKKLQFEPLEIRRVFTLPATLNFAEGDLIAYNGPTVDLVNDTSSFDAFVDFPGDVDSFFLAPQFSGSYTIDVGDFGNAVDPEVAVYSASTGVRLGYNDDSSSFNDDAHLVMQLTADTRYIVAVADNLATASGNVTIIVSAPFRTGSFLLTPDTFGDVSAAVTLDVPTDIDYYSFTAPAAAKGGLTISTTASTISQRLALFDSSGVLMQGPFLSIAISNAIPNSEYRVAVYSDGYTAAGSLTLNIDFDQSGVAVTNTSDAGPGSLRQAILDANAHPNKVGAVDKIRFDIPGPGPHSIALASALPVITEGVEIDGRTQPGTGATPTVSIDGSALAGAIDGLKIMADNTVVRKLNIRKFPSDGIELRANSAVIEGNTIGTDAAGNVGLGNKGFGILIANGSRNRIESNVISANGLSGIEILGNAADNNSITDNTIGAKFGGSVALPNSGNGIVIENGDLNIVSRNVISGNKLAGVIFTGTAIDNQLIGNKIGTNSAGTLAMPNFRDGVVIQSARNKIGGNLASLRNVISGNGKSGITIAGSEAQNNVIEGNYIGTDVSGTVAIPNVSDGIRVVNAANNRIGSSTDAAAGNVISGNGGSGISFSNAGSSRGLVVGNFIGTAADGKAALGNTGSGVQLTSGATNVQIGANTPISQNVIAANGTSGVSISKDSSNNRVSRNRIGVNVSGGPRGNGNAGVIIQGSNNTIGGASAAFANIISSNPQGIVLSGVNATNNTIAFNTIGTDSSANTGRGIQVSGGAASNTIGPKNTIRRNETGIRINSDSIKNKITQNSISENINLGIDLLANIGLTANDPGDADSGANRLQNFPTLASNPVLVGNDLEVAFSVNSLTTNATYPLTIEFFVSDGGGEGATFLASTTYTAANFSVGVKTISFAGVGTGLTAGVSKIVATATDQAGNTSEFSGQRTVVVSSSALRVAAQESRLNTSDVNSDGILNSTDALLVIGYVNDARTNNLDKSNVAVVSHLRADVNDDGQLSPQDVLLVLRDIQLSNSNQQAITAIDNLLGVDVWDYSSVEQIAMELADVREALSHSPWVRLT